ncbi:MAG: tetratricopeptide (TPR) repeat protein [Candidatus Azotimanducaceae bacterium]|jgi:tetratricopeptide (TPR) repeat protein
MRKIIFFFLFLLPMISLAQEQQLAYDYFRKGEYEKAASVYEKLYVENKFNAHYLSKLIDCYQQLEEFTKAKESIEKHLEEFPSQVHFYVEIGYNYELQYLQSEADSYYKKALSTLDVKTNYGYSIGKAFQENHLLDYALEAYKKTMIQNPKANYNIQVASIYGEKGEISNMFDTYLSMVDVDEKYTNTIMRYIGKYITDDSQNEYNTVFKRLVLKRLQSNQKNSWNELLSWLFMQQKDYDKAYIQEKALHKRSLESLEGIVRLGEIAFDNKEYETTEKCFDYVLENTVDVVEIMDAKLYKLYINIETSEDFSVVNSQFQALFNEYGKSTSTLDIQIAYADFLTFKYNQPDQAIKVLKGALKLRSNNFQKGAIKIKLGEVLVFNNRFNEALIYFSQVQASLKNHILAQKARFKVAQTSYYKGDFDWAETQLKVLKGSTSQLIANDALDLSLIINDNIVQDSLRLALKTYAQADLLAYQHKNQQAVDSLNTILTQHKGHAIEDEALFKQAKVFEEMKLYEKAESNYLKIIKINAEDILVDDAYYNLGEINSQQNNIEKAKEYYQKIIFDFPSSIHLVDARKKYRKLRGDDVIK